jgi:hypothetical protein
LLALVAALAVSREREQAPGEDDAAGETPVSEEMEELWRERLAHGPSRERARTLLRRIHSLEAAGDADAARELAEQMRKL